MKQLDNKDEDMYRAEEHDIVRFELENGHVFDFYNYPDRIEVHHIRPVGADLMIVPTSNNVFNIKGDPDDCPNRQRRGRARKA